MQRPQTFMAQDDYLITQATYLSDFDQKVALQLYQPLVGPVALALYLTLWQEVTPHPVLTDRTPQTRLLDLLHINIDELFEARSRLEAVGLLKTYTQTDALSRFYAYELYAPVSPDRFFADDLLGLVLFDTVGETRYGELLDAFALQNVRRRDWQDVSASFLDVFSVKNPIAQPPLVAEGKEQVNQKPVPTVSLGQSSGYDWDLLGSLLSKSNLKAGELAKHQRALYQLASFYGLAPVDFARYIEAATSVVTGELSLSDLRRQVEQAFAGQKQLAPKPVATKVAVEDADQDLLQRAKSLPIREFITATKQAKNSRMFPSRNEISALMGLQHRNVFDDATINILVDHLLSDHDNINQALLDAVANSWLKEDVASPEQALAQIHQYRNNTQPAKSKRTRARAGQRQEAKPKWLTDGYVPQTEEVSPEMAAKLREQQAALNALEKGGNDDGRHA
ncbi:replication initiation and membrane attachment family protein [Lacticaseibacillus brantae]|nr:DnaD domain protein [Lacticaseibacillus brantae]